MSSHITNNQRETLAARDSISGNPTYLTTTSGKLDVNATASLAGVSIPISGATTAVGVAVVDGSGNQITSFGGGTQYADGTVAATPTGNDIMFQNDAASAYAGDNSIHSVSFTWPLPVTAEHFTALGNFQTGATANGNGSSILPGFDYTTLLFQVSSNPSMSGGTTVNFEIQNTASAGAPWTALSCYQVGTTNPPVTSTTSDGYFVVELPTVLAKNAVRARISGYSAGTVTVVGYASNLPYGPSVQNVISTGVVSSTNSTTATLLANATFTGTGTSVLGYSAVEVIVYSDQASASGGLLIEFSSDNSNWDDSSPWTFTPGGAGPNQGQSFIAGVRGQYVRVVYTNGGVNQTTFRLQTLLKPNVVNGDVVSINQGLNANNHAAVTNSQIFGVTTGGGGGYVPVKVNPSGTLTVDASNSTGLAATVSQSTAANLNATVVGTGTFAVQASLNAGTNAIGGITGAGSNAQIKDDSFYSDGVTSGILAVHSRLYNGTNYDRWHGDTTNGAWVNVKTGTIAATQSGSWAVNVSQINGVTPLMGNGVTGTGSQRVTIASDNTAFSVNPLSATAPVSTMNSASANSGVNSAMAAVFDDVSPTAITENSFGFVRMSANRNQYMTIRDAAGNERGANVNSSNQLSVSVDAIVANQSVNVAQLAGTTTSVNAGVVDAGTLRVVQANNTGRTLTSASGSVASSGNNTLVAAGTNKLKVYAFSLSTTSTTAVTCIFQSGASGTELWRVVLQAPTSVSTGANLAVTPPAWLFATASATLLNLNLSAAQTVHYSVSYYDEA